MIGGSILYLWLAGLDMGTAAEQLLNGMYTSYILLAVPLFILAAEFMNSGSITERLLRFCDALVGRFRGGLAQVNVVQSDHLRRHVGLGARRRRRHRQADADDDDRRTASTPPAFAAALTAASVGHRPDHPAVDPDGGLRARLRHLDRLPVPRRRRPGPAAGRSRRWRSSPSIARRRNFPVERAGAAARAARASPGSAFPALMMPVVLLGCIYSGVTTPDRGRRRRRRLRAS